MSLGFYVNISADIDIVFQADVYALFFSHLLYFFLIFQAEKEEEWRGRGRGGGKNIEKLRRQLAELEAQLVLASPHLLFQVRICHYKSHCLSVCQSCESSTGPGQDLLS